MKFRTLSTFEKDYKKLPQKIQKQFEKSIRLFSENPRHPSLRVKKMEGTKGIWEASVTISYRFTFNWESGVVTLRRIGTHNILKKEQPN